MSFEKILEKKYTKEILRSTISPKSVAQISADGRIPLHTTYRRVHELRHYDLLEVFSCSFRCGRKYFLYRKKKDT